MNAWFVCGCLVVPLLPSCETEYASTIPTARRSRLQRQWPSSRGTGLKALEMAVYSLLGGSIPGCEYGHGTWGNRQCACDGDVM